MEIITDYRSKMYPIGKKIINNKGCTALVLGKYKDNRKLYVVQFQDEYKAIKFVSSKHLKDGIFKNPYYPIVSNTGYLGQGIYKTYINGEYTKENNLWRSIISKCYNAKQLAKVNTYKDCTVDKRWHNYQNFCEDLPTLKNYKQWKESTTPREWQLDKDIKIKGNRIYSKDTCIFVTGRENTREARLTGLTYLAIDPNGNEYIFYNQRQFSNENNLDYKKVNLCINEKRHTHKGWKFKKLSQRGK